MVRKGKHRWMAVCLAFSLVTGQIKAIEPVLSHANALLRFEQPNFVLKSRDSRFQLQITQPHDDGTAADRTRDVQWLVVPDDLARIDASGLVTPLRSGSGTIQATLQPQLTAATSITIEFPPDEPAINFPNQVVPIFTKYGCNGGGCHGKLAGQNGFRLSLLGFEPREDFDHLVRESRGRRIVPPAPDTSLLLQKSVGSVPHGGGQRMEIDSHDYRLLKRWIAQGMPYGDENHRKVTGIEVIPSNRMARRNASQQLKVLATYVDGSQEDITQTVQYESNNLDMADVSATGLVQLRDKAGEVSVMARYQGKVAVFRASIPLGTKIEQWPEERGPIDRAVFAKLKSLGIPPSPLVSDASFLRRVTLDIAGRLPTLDEIEQSKSQTREQIIDRLLESDDHASFFANKWSAILRNRHTSEETRYASYAFHDWLVNSIRDNKAYDQFVRELLTASGSIQVDPALVWFRQVDNTESRIEDIAQLFLGQRLQCARCHHHPYEKWGQQDYYHMAAFLSTVQRREGDLPQEPRFVLSVAAPMAHNPKSGAALNPAGLDEVHRTIQPTDDPRVALTDWMTDPANPYFAKSIANRYWKHFFGRGLVEPEDDMRITNPPSNPELMEALAKMLVESKFDLKHLVRSICTSSTYQLSEQPTEENIHDSICYSRYYPKRLNAEVLLDAVDDVLGTQSRFDSLPAGTRAIELPSTSFSSYFLTVFGRPDSSTSCECERTTESNLAQSLHLMNSTEINSKLAEGTNRLSRWSVPPTTSDTESVAEAVRLVAIRNVSELYLRALSRTPSESELVAATQYILSRTDRLREAYEDLAWSLINSKEFLFNH